MRLVQIIKKNFKVLFRSKSSAFVVLVGPLLIIALIALALSNTHEFQINVGIVAPDQVGLTTQFITQLEKGEYVLTDFTSVDECIERIKLGSMNVCIAFPENFVIENEGSKEVAFYVDQSRTNLVESIISSVRSSIFITSDEISLELTNNLLQAINVTEAETSKQQGWIQEMTGKVRSASSGVETVETKSDLITTGVDEAEVEINAIDESTKILETETDKLLADLDELLDDIEAADVTLAGTTAVKDQYDVLKTASPDETAKITLAVEELNTIISAITANAGSAGIKSSAEKVQVDLESIRIAVSNFEESLGKISDEISAIEITSGSNIVNPFTVQINPISSISNKSSLMFPYFVTLIILFVGMMLSSTLVVMERKSRAFFRTFTAPISELSQIAGSYITNVIIIIAQLAIIFAGAYFYLDINVISNWYTSLTVLLLSISFFILLGTLLGYMFKTQEGTTIITISLAGLSIFLSNIILPIESFSQSVREILTFANPFMLSSELFKKTILHGAAYKDISTELIVMGASIIVILILVIIFQKLSFQRFFIGFSKRKILQRPHITKENYLKLGDGTMVKNVYGLLPTLQQMSEQEFKDFVSKRHNEFALWIKDVFKDKKLAKKIKKAKTKDAMLKALENHLIE
jgi:ABC-type multidrug transport system permease subunit